MRDEDIFGNEMDWDHHKIDENEISRNQKIKGDKIQFKGLR